MPRTPAIPANQVRSPYLPNVDPDLARELLTMRQNIQQLQQHPALQPAGKGGGPNLSAVSASQMDYIRKNLQIGGSHPINLSGLLKGY